MKPMLQKEYTKTKEHCYRKIIISKKKNYVICIMFVCILYCIVYIHDTLVMCIRVWVYSNFRKVGTFKCF